MNKEIEFVKRDIVKSLVLTVIIGLGIVFIYLKSQMI